MIYSVAEVNHLAAKLFSSNLMFNNIEVNGEISGGKLYSSGHFYFTLKDENASIQATMFRSAYQKLTFIPNDGDKVMVKGNVSIYEKNGKYQIIVSEMNPAGIGDLYSQFENLKKTLQHEGYFSNVNKKIIPRLPRRIGVATSESGAVIQDILNVLRRRFPGFKMDFISVAVQGETAAYQVAKAIQRFNELNRVDVIIIARGGGSLEDLWAFNERIVADAIYESDIPIISAIGHETDFTIADFVSDLRAPTPSAAAELVLPEKTAMIEAIHQQHQQCQHIIDKQIKLAKFQLNQFKDRSVFSQPERIVQNHALYLDDLKNRMTREMRKRKDAYEHDLHFTMNQMKHNFSRQINSKENLLQNLKISLINSVERIMFQQKQLFSSTNDQLRVLNPLSILDRGYTYVTDKDGNIISSSQNLRVADEICMVWKDGEAIAEIKNVIEH